MERLSECITLLLLVLAVKESLNLVNLLLNRINRLCLGAKLNTLGFEGRAALNNLLLNL